MDEYDTYCDRILGQTTGLLAERGDDQAVALLVDVQSISLHSTDKVIGTRKIFDTFLTGDDGPLTETLYRREAVLDIPDHLIPAFTDEVCGRIAATLRYVAERNGEANVALWVPIIHPCWSGSMAVFVEGAAEPVPSADIQLRDPLRIGNRLG
jgi:hypothetical protein